MDSLYNPLPGPSYGTIQDKVPYLVTCTCFGVPGPPKYIAYPQSPIPIPSHPYPDAINVRGMKWG